MNGHETVFITDPDLSESDLAVSLQKVKDTVSKYNGEVQQYHLWGRRRLAYQINKKSYGVYHILYITGDGQMLKELHDHYRFSDEIIRFQTVKVESIQEESERFLGLLKQSQEKQEKPSKPEKSDKPETETKSDATEASPAETPSAPAEE